MEQHETDWRTILLLLGAAGGALMAYGLAGLLVLYGGMNALNPSAAAGGRTTFEFVVLAAAPLVIGTFFLPAVYYSIRRLLGRRTAAGPIPDSIPGRVHPLALGRTLARGPAATTLLYGLVATLVWVGIAVLAGRLVTTPILKWITPALYVLAILIPAGFFLWIATRGINPGSPQRRWGALAAGVGLGIVPAMAAELILALIALIVLVFYLALNPGQLSTFENLAHQLQNSNDINQVLNTAGPLLTSPVVLIIALLFFSGFSPLIEEIAKSLATWTVFDRLTSPAQGFAIGAISGTAFGLVESLLVSAQPDTSWTTTLLVRGASTMMHIMSASLTGWGIGQFRTTRRVLPLIGMYAAAMSLHGIWNGSVVVMTIGSVRNATVSGGRDLPGMLLIYAGAAVLVVLCLAIPLALWAINWRLRHTAAVSHGVTGAQQELQPGALPLAPEVIGRDTEPRRTADDTPSPPLP